MNVPMFRNQPLFCSNCGKSFDGPISRGNSIGSNWIYCGMPCYRELEWKNTLYILGKKYYPRPPELYAFDGVQSSFGDQGVAWTLRIKLGQRHPEKGELIRIERDSEIRVFLVKATGHVIRTRGSGYDTDSCWTFMLEDMGQLVKPKEEDD